MKNTIKMFAMFIMVAAFAVAASAQVTGDFKVLSATYTGTGDADGGDVKVAGSMNHGSVQSGKTAIVEVNYGYSFEYSITTTVNGVTTTTTPARCPNVNDNACRSNGNSANWSPTITITPYSTTSTQFFNGASSMTAITTPTVVNGRLNPKGKITGYNWNSAMSVVPTDSIVDTSLIPAGAQLVEGSVKITSVAYKAYLKDAEGNEIADTVVTGSFTF